MAIDVVNTKQFAPLAERAHFSQAVRAGGLLLCSGSIGFDADGTVPEKAEDEFRNVFTTIGEVLAEAGLGWEDVVEMTSYHVAGSPEDQATFMKVRDEFLSPPWCAWTGVGVAALAVEGARVEVRVTAQLR